MADDLDQTGKLARANEIIAYQGPISAQLTRERTSLESALIPVTAYIIVACVESYMRYPEMIRAIDAALPAEEIGRRARRPGSRVNTVYLWSIVNFYLLGRKILGALNPGSDLLDPTYDVLDFWDRCARGFRGDGTRQAHDTGSVTPYDEALIAQIVAAATPVTDDETRDELRRFNATLVGYLFLLYLDTRVGAGDTGPYDLGDGRVLLVRDYYHLAESDFPWSDVAAGVPYSNLVAGLVLQDVEFRITDFGTSVTTPEDYIDRLVGFSLFTTDGCEPGDLRELDLAEVDTILGAVRKAQATHYRNLAAMSRDEKVRAGAYVYFTFLLPFAEEAGVADQLDWTVPRDLDPMVYEMLSAVTGENTGDLEDTGPYYAPMEAT